MKSLTRSRPRLAVRRNDIIRVDVDPHYHQSPSFESECLQTKTILKGSKVVRFKQEHGLAGAIFTLDASLPLTRRSNTPKDSHSI